MLHIFPSASLDSSILTSVLVGLLVLWVFYETWGWTFSGLVVPGYLATILVFEPGTGAVILGEALATYLVVHALSESVPRWWPWTPLFGRDRFFLVLLVSVGVRVMLEGGALAWLQQHSGFMPQAELHSMGLVVVPLAANALWRTGLASGLPRLGLPVLITWFILRFVLLDHTNLSLTNFQLSFEDLALDFASSPKAYVVLLAGAWLASRANLRWGWDFGGIVVPALLALCWLQPLRLLATVGEALVVAALLAGVVRLPGFKTANLTGGRPLVLSFALAYLVKFGMAWGLGEAWPGLRVHELFGFGYLLPCLLALRIHKHRSVSRVMLPVVVTSLAGWLVGSAFAGALVLMLPQHTVPPDEAAGLPRGGSLTPLLVAAQGQATPGGLESLPEATSALTISGGERFASLRWNPAGGELVVAGTIGSARAGEAAVAAALALDARGLLLCRQRDVACEETAALLSQLSPVLWVETGDVPQLEAGGQLPRSITLSRLVELVPSLSLVTGPAGVRLVLDPASQFELNHGVLSASPAAWPADWARSSAPAVPLRYGAAELSVLRDHVIAPWVGWTPGTDPRRLDLVAGAAKELGLELSVQGDRTLLRGDDWWALSRPGGAPVVVHVPRAPEEPEVLETALALVDALDAALLVVDLIDPHAHEQPGVHRPAQACVLQAVSQAPALEVVTLRGTRDVYDPGSEAVLSLARPMADMEPLPSVATSLTHWLDAYDVQPVFYDGSAQRLSFSDSGNPLHRALEGITGRRGHLTLFVGHGLRERVATERRVGELP